MHSSPTGLLERETLLETLDALLAKVRGGEGHFLFLGGEAGVGKTTLLRRFSASASRHARVLHGGCDPLSTPRPLGPLHDMAAELGDAVYEMLHGDGDRSRLFDALLRELHHSARPVVIVIEDVHWADAATLDLLRFLGRRLTQIPALLIASYRDDEVGPHHPLTMVLGTLTAPDVVHRLVVPRLSESAVRALAVEASLDADELYARTGGNPYFVSEVIIARSAGVPDTVRDAVLARVGPLPQAARRTLEAAAVIGSQVEPWLLQRVVEDDVESMETCVSLGVLQPRGTHLEFRHEIAREVILSTLMPWRRLIVHRAVLEALRSSTASADPNMLARLAHHAEGAEDREAVITYAPAAARQAARLRAHREAARQYARALRHAGGLAPRARAELLEAMAYECYLTSAIDEAIAARREALGVRRSLGDRLEEGENLRWLSRLSWFAGRRRDALESADESIEILEVLPAGSELAWAYSNRAQLDMLEGAVDAAVAGARRAVGLAQRLEDDEVLVHATNNLGTALLLGGDERAGMTELQRSLEVARLNDFEEHAARAFTNLASTAITRRRLVEGARFLQQGIEYCIEHDLDAWQWYMEGWRSILLLFRGSWSEAEGRARRLLAEPRLPVVSRIQPLVVVGTLAARRDEPGATAALDEALELATMSEELQRLAPVAAARAEAAWLRGDASGERGLVNRVYALAERREQPWEAGEVGFWRWKIDGWNEPPDWLAEPFRLQIIGSWPQAKDAWERLGCPFEAARAASESVDASELRGAHGSFERLGARACAAALAQRIRELGFRAPRRVSDAAAAHHAGLTVRQQQVLEMLAEGLTNAQIAARLQRSTRTIDHHVAAILAKFGARSRTEAVRIAVRDGMVGDG